MSVCMCVCVCVCVCVCARRWTSLSFSSVPVRSFASDSSIVRTHSRPIMLLFVVCYQYYVLFDYLIICVFASSLLLRCVAFCVVASSQKTPNTGQNRIVRVSVRANGITRKQTHNILLLNYTILGHTRWFAASAYCVQYLSIACDAASGHTCT